ncbi:hypothetical protein ACWEO4_21510 [Streptomyces sp. NPDC004393]|uniref:hypothetical protein n=1 Tax=unclassified Streptomyces TaxID=2593676 RepID=UPI0033B2FE71
MAVATLAVALGAGSADATGYVAVKNPYLKSGKIYAEATLQGPNPVDTKMCVSLLQTHPATPDIPVAGKCSKLSAGTVKVSINNFCGRYTTHVEVSRGGRTLVYKDSASVIICN